MAILTKERKIKDDNDWDMKTSQINILHVNAVHILLLSSSSLLFLTLQRRYRCRIYLQWRKKTICWQVGITLYAWLPSMRPIT